MGGGGKIYCYANFFCYAIVFELNFREGQKFSGGQTVSGGAPPCPPVEESQHKISELSYHSGVQLILKWKPGLPWFNYHQGFHAFGKPGKRKMEMSWNIFYCPGKSWCWHWKVLEKCIWKCGNPDQSTWDFTLLTIWFPNDHSLASTSLSWRKFVCFVFWGRGDDDHEEISFMAIEFFSLAVKVFSRLPFFQVSFGSTWTSYKNRVRQGNLSEFPFNISCNILLPFSFSPRCSFRLRS